MHDPSTGGLIEALNNAIGGAATAFVAAVAGRLMWLAGEVRAKRRPLLSLTLIWELPMAFGMALIGDGLSDYLALSDTTSIAVISAVSYLGPRGAGAIIERWIDKRS